MFEIRNGALLGFAIGITVIAAGCGSTSPQSARSPADQAAFMERTRCSPDDDEKALAPVIHGALLQSVRPLYAMTTSGKQGTASDLRGVVISVAAQAGVTDVWLDRALECHSARATLGHVPAGDDDPFFLPGSTVDIDVRSAKDGFDIAINGYSTGDSMQVFSRAEAFAKARNAAAPKSAEAAR